MATKRGKLSIIWPIIMALLVNRSRKSPRGPLRDKMRYNERPIITAGTDINVLKREISARRNGNLKKARTNAMRRANGVAIKIAEKETPKESEIISHISLLPLRSK